MSGYAKGLVMQLALFELCLSSDNYFARFLCRRYCNVTIGTAGYARHMKDFLPIMLGS